MSPRQRQGQLLMLILLLVHDGIFRNKWKWMLRFWDFLKINWCLSRLEFKGSCIDPASARSAWACAFQALGLLPADSALTVGRGKTFWRFGQVWTKSWKIVTKVGNEPSLRGQRTGCWPKLGSYGKSRIFVLKNWYLGPKRTPTS